MYSEEIHSLLVDKIVEKLDPAFILLFGSYAKGTAHADSDVDLAFFGGNELSSYDRFIFISELAEVAGTEVDLVDLKTVDTVFAMQIFGQAILLYVQDEDEWIRQKMRAYSMYATLSEQRATVMDAIMERGSVFGDE